MWLLHLAQRDSKQRSIDWHVRSEFDKFPFQIGQRRFSGMVDTGAAGGIYMPWKSFKALVRADAVRNVFPCALLALGGQVMQGAMVGKCKVSFYDSDDRPREFKLEVIGLPGYKREGEALIGREFLANFGRYNFSFSGKLRMFEGIVYK